MITLRSNCPIRYTLNTILTTKFQSRIFWWIFGWNKPKHEICCRCLNLGMASELNFKFATKSSIIQFNSIQKNGRRWHVEPLQFLHGKSWWNTLISLILHFYGNWRRVDAHRHPLMWIWSLYESWKWQYLVLFVLQFGNSKRYTNKFSIYSIMPLPLRL